MYDVVSKLLWRTSKVGWEMCNIIFMAYMYVNLLIGHGKKIVVNIEVDQKSHTLKHNKYAWSHKVHPVDLQYYNTVYVNH